MYKNSITNIKYPLFLALAVVAGIFIGKVTSHRTPLGNQGRTMTGGLQDNKLINTISLIGNRYVDPVDMDSLADVMMPTLLAQLDPHSVYIPASEFTEVNDALEGEFEGIGVMFNMATDTVVVMNVIPQGPSDIAGVQNGDRIIMIDDSLVAGKKVPQTDILKMLKGKGGTDVRLSIMRPGRSELVPVTVTRDKVLVKSVDAAYMIRPGIGFVKLSSFSKNSASEIGEALSKLKSEGMNKLIFDLRGNPGGFLDQAILIANDFLPADKLIVYTEDRNKKRNEQFSNGRGKYADLELVVLIDEGSASSSEILAGALQDNDRGTVVGRRSFGKGLVQEPISFPDGSAIRLTVARYYTPTGRSIQKPYDKGGSQEYEMEISGRFDHSEFFTADSIRFDDSKKFVTSGGKVVYGGGGIMPDMFVPLDTSMMSAYYMQVVGRNILYRFTMDYADRHRAALNAVKSIQDLNALLDADTGMLDRFVQYAASHGVKPDYAGIEVARPLLTARLRSYIARNTALDDVGLYSQTVGIDNETLKALELLQKNKKSLNDDK